MDECFIGESSAAFTNFVSPSHLNGEVIIFLSSNSFMTSGNVVVDTIDSSNIELHSESSLPATGLILSPTRIESYLATWRESF